MSARTFVRARYITLPCVLFGLVSGVVAAFTIARNTPGLERAIVVFMNTAYWSAWGGLALLALHGARTIRFTRQRWVRPLLFHLAASVVFTAVHLVFIAMLDAMLRALLVGEPWAVDAGVVSRISVEWEITLYWGLVAVAHALEFQAEAEAGALAELRLESALARAELKALQRQLQPHFLFNTLQAIAALVHTDPELADTVVQRLSALLRTTLKFGDAREIRFDQELATLDDYIAIEAVKMGRRLSVAREVGAETLGCLVPPLLLQPIVENAIRHGIQPRAEGGHIHIRAWQADDRLHVRVVDDGVGIGGGRSDGIGLVNTRQRLDQLYGDRASLELAPAMAGGVTVSVVLPCRTAATDASAAASA